jgi:hypothetical protein
MNRAKGEDLPSAKTPMWSYGTASLLQSLVETCSDLTLSTDSEGKGEIRQLHRHGWLWVPLE